MSHDSCEADTPAYRTNSLSMSSGLPPQVLLDYGKIKELLKEAEAGNVKAQYAIGCDYYNKRSDKAVVWLTKAATSGHLSAQFLLGVCFLNGNIVKSNHEKGFRWVKQAATNGHLHAQHLLAVCYEHGFGVEIDLEEAFVWYKEAGDKGNTLSLYNLGLCYRDGKGVGQDKKMAKKCWQEAAKNEDPASQFMLVKDSPQLTPLHVMTALKSADKRTYKMIQELQVSAIETEDGLKFSYESLDKSDFELLGIGHFGHVAKCSWKGKEVAFKHLGFDPFDSLEILPYQDPKVNSSSKIAKFIHEAKVCLELSRSEHPNVLLALGFSISPFGLITELMTTSLSTFLRKEALRDSLLNLGVLVDFAKQIALGMQFLHKKRVVHRDLAARNVLLSGNLECKISDFGAARTLEKEREYGVENTASDEALPLRHMPPESIDAYTALSYSFKTDVWSYGVACWEIFSFGATPYGPFFSLEQFQQVKTGRLHLDKPPPLPIDLWLGLVQPCLELDPTKRPEFSDIVAKISHYQKASNQEIPFKSKVQGNLGGTLQILLSEYARLKNIWTSRKETPHTPIRTAVESFLERLKEKFSDNPIVRVALFGTSHSGKSSLLNALMGSELLPVSVGIKPSDWKLIEVQPSDSRQYETVQVSHYYTCTDLRSAIVKHAKNVPVLIKTKFNQLPIDVTSPPQQQPHKQKKNNNKMQKEKQRQNKEEKVVKNQQEHKQQKPTVLFADCPPIGECREPVDKFDVAMIVLPYNSAMPTVIDWVVEIASRMGFNQESVHEFDVSSFFQRFFIVLSKGDIPPLCGEPPLLSDEETAKIEAMWSRSIFQALFPNEEVQEGLPVCMLVSSKWAMAHCAFPSYDARACGLKNDNEGIRQLLKMSKIPDLTNIITSKIFKNKKSIHILSTLSLLQELCEGLVRLETLESSNIEDTRHKLTQIQYRLQELQIITAHKGMTIFNTITTDPYKYLFIQDLNEEQQLNKREWEKWLLELVKQDKIHEEKSTIHNWATKLLERNPWIFSFLSSKALFEYFQKKEVPLDAEHVLSVYAMLSTCYGDNYSSNIKKQNQQPQLRETWVHLLNKVARALAKKGVVIEDNTVRMWVDMLVELELTPELVSEYTLPELQRLFIPTVSPTTSPTSPTTSPTTPNNQHKFTKILLKSQASKTEEQTKIEMEFVNDLYSSHLFSDCIPNYTVVQYKTTPLHQQQLKELLELVATKTKLDSNMIERWVDKLIKQGLTPELLSTKSLSELQTDLSAATNNEIKRGQTLALYRELSKWQEDKKATLEWERELKQLDCLGFSAFTNKSKIAALETAKGDVNAAACILINS